MIKKKKNIFDDASASLEQFINWKSVGLLKKYMTRFGDIKPRAYTFATVTQQKKLKKAISMARELGVLPYIK